MALVLAGSAFAAFPAYDPVVFEELETAGVRFVVEPSRTPHRHQPETMISGIALLDYDGDGWLDIYVVNGATMPGQLLGQFPADAARRSSDDRNLVGE